MGKNDIKDVMVEHPSHYTFGKYECIDVLEDLLLNKNLSGDKAWLLGNAMKYLWRVGNKNSGSISQDEKSVQDLKKAIFYINRLIERYS